MKWGNTSKRVFKKNITEAEHGEHWLFSLEPQVELNGIGSRYSLLLLCIHLFILI